MKNNVDKIFNESLQHYERQPRTEAWEKLQARLEKRDSKVLPLWWKYASAASIALLLGLGGYWFSSQKETQAEVATISNKPVLKKRVDEIKKIQMAKVEESKRTGRSLVAGVHGDAQSSSLVRKHTQRLEDISPVVNVQSNVQTSSQIRKDLENQNNPIVALETIKSKTLTEQNTIVLVLENTKPKKEEETIVLNFVDTKVETVAQNIEPEKKQSRVGKIWEQLKRAKNGENVNWSRLGVKPQKILARADAKIENVLSKGEEDNQ